MSLVESESLVIKSYNLAEADRIVVFLTREHGMIRGVAKGVKRLKSRFGSSLEPYSIVNLEYFQKDGPGWQDRINDALRAVMQGKPGA